MQRDEIRRRLMAAIGVGTLVRVARDAEPAALYTGFVLAVGRKWVLLARTADGGHAEGHIAFRLRDIKAVRWDTSFESRAAKMLPSWPRLAPVPLETLDLDRTRGMLQTLVAPSQLVAIQFRNLAAGLSVGVMERLTPHHLVLREIAPDASWDEDLTHSRMGRLSVVETGSRYLQSLEMVADSPSRA
ncbi:hypothetical protein [Frigoribacterium endophyticum]|jgi:hypothetical protein|uniref:hypothetical protein n=1 Tax=Frigoribacterium endophyticum TaxID=1522176 RepID=UPI001423E150|nr:hypothetical protein [Frigoribacterium endophyticum]NII51190.1 hypothetical protein [Frigoribacterium endophyticum]